MIDSVSWIETKYFCFSLSLLADDPPGPHSQAVRFGSAQAPSSAHSGTHECWPATRRAQRWEVQERPVAEVSFHYPFLKMYLFSLRLFEFFCSLATFPNEEVLRCSTSYPDGSHLLSKACQNYWYCNATPRCHITDWLILFIFILQGAEKSPAGKSGCRGEGSVHRPGFDAFHTAGWGPSLAPRRQEDEPLTKPDHILKHTFLNKHTTL